MADNRKKVRDLLVSVGKNPDLVKELASKGSRSERVKVLQDHGIIKAENELPTKEDAEAELTQLLAPSENQEDLAKGIAAIAFICVIVYTGSSE